MNICQQWHRIASTLSAAAMILFGSAASAVEINSSLSARLFFDLSQPPMSPAIGVIGPGLYGPVYGITPSPPFDNINFQLYFSPADDVTAGEGFALRAFDESGSPVSTSYSLSFAGPTGGGMESGFGGPQPVGMFSRLTSFRGYLEMSDVVGSFDLTSFRVLAHPEAGDLVATGWIEGGRVETIVAPVPEPETYAMTLLGLTLVALAARRRRRTVAATSTLEAFN